MVTQKPICLKIDTQLLEQLDNECQHTWHKRNWHINRAIALYMDLTLLRRQLKLMQETDTKTEVINSWLRKNVPEGAKW